VLVLATTRFRVAGGNDMKLARPSMLSASVLAIGAALAPDVGGTTGGGGDSVLVRYAIVLVDRGRPSGGPALDLREMADVLPYALLEPAIDGALVEYAVFPVIGLMVDDGGRMELPSSQEQRELLAEAFGVDGGHGAIAIQVSVEESAHGRSLGLATALVLEGGPQGGADEQGAELFRVRSEGALPGVSMFIVPAGTERDWVIVADCRWSGESRPPEKGNGPVPRK
jgi:hypothetical protein